MAEPDPLLTVKDVARLLRISLAATYALVQEGELPCYRIGRQRGSIRVAASDVSSYLAERRLEPAPAKKPPPRPRLKHLRL